MKILNNDWKVNLNEMRRDQFILSTKLEYNVYPDWNILFKKYVDKKEQVNGISYTDFIDAEIELKPTASLATKNLVKELSYFQLLIKAKISLEQKYLEINLQIKQLKKLKNEYIKPPNYPSTKPCEHVLELNAYQNEKLRNREFAKSHVSMYR